MLLMICLFTTCKKEEVATKEYPRLNTLDVTTINETGATFNAEIISGNIADIKEYGFVWDTNGNPNIGLDDQLVIPGQLIQNKFSAEINSSLVKGVTYYVKPYVKSSGFLVYGKYVSFISSGSEAPVILNFTPKTGVWGDTIKITGKYFRSRNEGVIVKLGELQASVISISDSTIKIVIPDKTNSELVNLSVSVIGKIATSLNQFSYKVPVISGISPEYVTFSDTVYIKGNNLISARIQPTVNFNVTRMAIVFASEKLIKIVLPVSYKTKTTSIAVIGPTGFITAGMALKLKDLLLMNYMPDSVFKPAAIITINGKNFNPVISNNQVLIDGFKATILEGTTQQLKVQLPDEIIPDRDVSVIKSAEILINCGELNVKAPKNLEVKWRSKWTKKNNFPGPNRAFGVGFSIGQKGYNGLGINENENKYLKDLWEYDQKSDSWLQKADFPGEGRINQTGTVMNGIAYVGLGNGFDTHENMKDFYKFDPFENSWSKIADYGGKARGLAVSFVSEGQLFVGGGMRYPDASEGPSYYEVYINDCWGYDPLLNKWTPQQNIPDLSPSDVAITIDNSIYKFGVGKMWQLSGSSWIDKGNGFFSGERIGILQFVIGSTGYLYKDISYGNSLFSYQPSSGKYALLKIPDKVLSFQPSVFSIGNKAYFVGGITYNDPKSVWEFDPSLPVN